MEQVTLDARPSIPNQWNPAEIAVGCIAAVAAVASVVFLALILSEVLVVSLPVIIVVGVVGVAVLLAAAVFLTVMRCCSREVVEKENPLSDESIRKTIMADMKSPVAEVRNLVTENADSISFQSNNIDYKIPWQFDRDIKGDARYLLNDEVAYAYNPEIQEENDPRQFYLKLIECCIAQVGEEKKGTLIAERIARSIVQSSSADLVKVYLLEYMEKGMMGVPDRIDDVYRVWISNGKVIIEKKELYVIFEQQSHNYLESRVNTRTITISMSELAVENLEAFDNPLPTLAVIDKQTNVSNHLPEILEGLPEEYVDYTGEQHEQIRRANEEWKEKLKGEFREWYLNIERESLEAKNKPQETKKDI